MRQGGIRIPAAWRGDPEMQALYQQLVRSIGVVKLANWTVATLPDAATAGAGMMIYVSDESGGAVPAFSDGVAWRRVTDRAVVS